MTSADRNHGEENPSKENMTETPQNQDGGEVVLDPHPSQALKELVTGDQPTTNPDESSSKNV